MQENLVLLNQNDSLVDLDEKTAKKVVATIGRGNLLTSEKEFIEMAISMGGIFWSERKKTVVPGKLTSGMVLGKSDFLSRLKNTAT